MVGATLHGLCLSEVDGDNYSLADELYSNGIPLTDRTIYQHHQASLLSYLRLALPRP